MSAQNPYVRRAGPAWVRLWLWLVPAVLVALAAAATGVVVAAVLFWLRPPAGVAAFELPRALLDRLFGGAALGALAGVAVGLVCGSRPVRPRLVTCRDRLAGGRRAISAVIDEERCRRERA